MVSCINISFPLLLFLIVSTYHVAHAHDSPQDYLDAHNAARSEVGVPNVIWDETLAAFAESYASKHKGDCQPVHSGGVYGENLAICTGDLNGTDAVKLWVDEIKNYDYNSNSCNADCECHHYTQVVWSNTVHVGCAKVRCDNGGTWIGCNYDPPGNFVGDRPY